MKHFWVTYFNRITHETHSLDMWALDKYSAYKNFYDYLGLKHTENIEILSIRLYKEGI